MLENIHLKTRRTLEIRDMKAELFAKDVSLNVVLLCETIITTPVSVHIAIS